MYINIASIDFRQGGGVCVLMNIISRHSWLDYGLVCVLQKPRLFLAVHMCHKSALLWQQESAICLFGTCKQALVWSLTLVVKGFLDVNTLEMSLSH